MSDTHYRGLFRRRHSPDRHRAEEDTRPFTPGELHVSDNGDLKLEIWGDSGKERDLSDSSVWFDGELEAKPGPCVTLERCLQTSRHWGSGGGTESWLAHRAFFGKDYVYEADTFKTVTMTLKGLGPFLGHAPVPAVEDGGNDSVARAIRIPIGRSAVERFPVDDWTVEFGWISTGSWGPTGSNIIQKPFVSIELLAPKPVDGILVEGTPTFEALLSIACRSHAAITQIEVVSGDGSDSFEIVAPRVDSRLDTEPREPHSFELLFRNDDTDVARAIRQVRLAFDLVPGFFPVYLGGERAPSRYVDDRVRNAITALALLVPAAGHLGLKDVEAMLHTGGAGGGLFAPSEELLALPAFVDGIWGAKLGHALGVDSPARFIDEVGASFRWVSYRTGAPLGGRELIATHQRLRSLIHVALLRFIGFDATRAEEIVAEAVMRYGPLNLRA